MANDTTRVDPALFAEVTQNVCRISDCDATALILTTPSFGYGGNWALLPSTKSDFKDVMAVMSDEIRKDMAENKCKAWLYAVENGAVLTVSPKWIDKTMYTLAPKAYVKAHDTFMAQIIKTQKEEPEIAVKLIKRIAKGDCTEFKKVNGGYSGLLGLYCTNSKNSLSANGVSYPAVKFDLMKFAMLCKQCGLPVYVHIPDGLKPIWEVVQANPVRAHKLLKFATGDDGKTVLTANGLFLPIYVKAV